MTYSAIAFPSTILCGKCGHLMRADETFHIGQPVIVRCTSTQCEHYDIALAFPVTQIELTLADQQRPAADPVVDAIRRDLRAIQNA